MGTGTSRYAEIVVRVVPTPISATEGLQARASRATDPKPTRAYDALIYTDLHLDGLTRPQRPPAGQPAELAALPLVAVEHLLVRWSRYEEYLATFVVGSKAPRHMRSRLFETLTPGIEVLFGPRPLAPDPVRVWWDCEAVELEDLPWELVAYAARPPMDSGFSFVRGLPPEPPPPLVPIDGPLRLALIHDPAHPPRELLVELEGLSGLTLQPMTGPPRAALQTAAEEGYELVHIVADGVVSLAFDGVLWLHDPRAPELPAGELSALLRGSRVTVLGLSSPGSLEPDMVEIGGRLVPSAYRAFAYLGSADLPLPSIVAPLGPIPSQTLGRFWRGFYSGLVDTLAIEEAMARGRAESFAWLGDALVPMALHLRHPHGRLFRRRTALTWGVGAVAPTRVAAELQVSQTLVTRLEALEGQAGTLPIGVTEFLEEERRHQDQLVAELEPWVRLEAGE